MTEIWLNYGQNEVVLDIQAENLDQRLSVEGQTLEGSKVDEKLDGIDLSKPTEIALLNYTKSVQEVLGKIFEKPRGEFHIEFWGKDLSNSRGGNL